MSTDDMKPEWDPIWLVCEKCSHEWDDWQPILVPVVTWVAHVKTYRCPQCGAGGESVLVRVNRQ